MASIGDVVEELHTAMSEGDDAIQRLRRAREALDDTARTFYEVAHGTNDQEFAMVHDQLITAVDDIELLIAGLEAERGRLGDLIAYHSGGDVTDHEQEDDLGGDQGNNARPQPVRSPYGDMYPPGTEWAVDRLPPYSPLKSNQPVRGFMRLDRGEPIELKPGSPGRMAGQTAARGRRLGMDEEFRRSGAPGHVEFIAAMRMIEAGATSVHVVINRSPCGLFAELEGDKDKGCHQYLPAFLPRGTRLHLYGTLGGDTVFIHTYEGEADR